MVVVVVVVVEGNIDYLWPKLIKESQSSYDLRVCVGCMQFCVIHLVYFYV